MGFDPRWNDIKMMQRLGANSAPNAVLDNQASTWLQSRQDAQKEEDDDTRGLLNGRGGNSNSNDLKSRFQMLMRLLQKQNESGSYSSSGYGSSGGYGMSQLSNSFGGNSGSSGRSGGYGDYQKRYNTGKGKR